MDTVNLFECGCANCNVPGKEIVYATTVRQLAEDYFLALCEKCSAVYNEKGFIRGVEEDFKENTTTKAVRIPLLESNCVSCLTSGKKKTGAASKSIYWNSVRITNICESCESFWIMQDMYLRREQRVWVDERYKKFIDSLRIREVRHDKVVVAA